MKLHYLFSDRHRVLGATIKLDGQVQKNCTYVDDEKGYVIRRKFKQGLIDGSETVYGKVEIEIPAVGKHPYYKTPERALCK